MAYLDARDFRGLGAEAPQGVSAGAPIQQAMQARSEPIARPTKMNTAPTPYTVTEKVYHDTSAMRAGANRVEIAARNALLAKYSTPSSQSVPADAVSSQGGYAIPSVIAAPASTVSPLIAAIPSGGSTEEFNYGAPTGAPAEEFDYGGPTGAPTEEYGDAAEPDAGVETVTSDSALPAAAVAALAGAAIGLGPLGIAIAAGAGFLFGKG